MKFSIERDALVKPLQHIVGVVERRQTLPVLSNVLLVCENNQLILTTTDTEIEMVAQTTIDTVEAGRITVPARKFYDICRALPDHTQVDFVLDTEKQRAIIRSGKSRFNLSTLPADDFPNLQNIKPEFAFSIQQNQLKELIEKTQFAMAQQDVRFYLNGLLLEVSDGKVCTVATDGHRLAYNESDQDIHPEKVLQVILPRKGVTELGKVLEDNEEPVQIELSNNHVRIGHPAITFTTKLIDGKFPDYKRVIPPESGHEVTADRVLLKQALSRASILSNEKYRGIRLAIKPGTLQAQAHNPEMEEAEEEMEVDYQGDEIVVGFNVTYLIDAISVIPTEKARLVFNDANSSCLILADGEESTSKYVVMPMRL
ncbi:MAG: DNA polymerase III subunit beta [Gammaproteobacteria bacterium SG8_11]|nr:MAG: DNA polymerase III subunit beta [Gammaproteobacteria bacterium SG8_11]